MWKVIPLRHTLTDTIKCCCTLLLQYVDGLAWKYGLGGATRAGAALGGGWGGAENSWSRPSLENGINHGWIIYYLENLDHQRFAHYLHPSGQKGKLSWHFLIRSSWTSFTLWITWSAYQSWICRIWQWFMSCRSGFAKKTYLKPKSQVLVITNYRADQQQSMLRFGDLLTSNRNNRENLVIEQTYPTPSFQENLPYRKISEMGSLCRQIFALSQKD